MIVYRLRVEHRDVCIGKLYHVQLDGTGNRGYFVSTVTHLERTDGRITTILFANGVKMTDVCQAKFFVEVVTGHGVPHA